MTTHRAQTRPGHRPHRRLRRQGAVRPRTRAAAIDRHVADFVGHRPHGRARRVRTHRPARARGRRVRHRTVRTLVVPGSAVAEEGAARAARGRNAGRHPLRCAWGRLRRRTRRAPDSDSWGSGKDWRVWAGEMVSDLVQLNPRSSRPHWTPSTSPAATPHRTPAPELRERPDPARGTHDRAERLGIHGQQGLGRGYARDRAHMHAHATREIAAAVAAGHMDRRRDRLARRMEPAPTGLFPWLDARRRPARTTAPDIEEAAREILIVSWEYPPVVVGGLGRHVHHLATELVAAGHEVVVLCRRPTGTDASTHPVHPPSRTASWWSPRRRTRPISCSARTCWRGHWRWDTPWCGPASPSSRASATAGSPMSCTRTTGWCTPRDRAGRFYDVPLVSTLHATEAGRHSGWVSGRSTVRCTPWNGGWPTIRRPHHLFRLDGGGGDHTTRFRTPADHGDPQRNRLSPPGTSRSAPRPRPAQLLFVGRLEYEKGVQDVIAALPRIRRSHPGTTLAIAGEGTQLTGCSRRRTHRVARRRDSSAISTTSTAGWLHGADAIVLPSRYDRSASSRSRPRPRAPPLVASTAGGLGEAVVDGQTGMSFLPGDVNGLSSASARSSTTRRRRSARKGGP